MKLATFTEAHRRRIGVVDDETIVDLAAAVPHLPQTMIAFLRGGAEALAEAQRAARRQDAIGLPLANVRLEAPVPRPGKVLAIGLNYGDHIRETRSRRRRNIRCGSPSRRPASSGRTTRSRFRRCRTRSTTRPSLCVVIGRRCRHVPRERALRGDRGLYVRQRRQRARLAGSARRRMMMGKGFDTHGPTGPWIVTTDEIRECRSACACGAC